MFGRKSQKTNEAAVRRPNVTDTESGDNLGPYPANVDDSPTQQRVLERGLRNVTISLGISGMMNIAMISFIIAMFPLKEVQPYLITFKDQSNQVVSIDPLAIDAPGIAYATEDNVRDYINQRHSFTPVASAMTAQWGPDSRLAARTLKPLYEKFEGAMKTEQTRMMTQGFTRRINIETVNQLRPDTWQVLFETQDSLGGSGGTLTADPTRQQQSGTANVGSGMVTQETLLQGDLTPQIATQKWVATMTIDYQPQNTTYEKRLLNPLGFVVTDYSVTARRD